MRRAPSTPGRVMLDTQIYDLIIATPDMVRRLNALTDAGTLEILSTFAQEEELAAIPDDGKRRDAFQIKRTRVPAAAGPWGLAPWGEFPWGADGSEAGLPVSTIVSPKGKHWYDALIACTASGDADVLVTEDQRVRKRVAARGIRCAVWSFSQFRNCVFRLLKE